MSGSSSFRSTARPATPNGAGQAAADTTMIERRRAALVALLMAPFMAMLDVFIVNIAVPSIERQLPATFAEVQLVIGSYIVAFAMGLVTGGRLGDMFGRQRVFIIGLVGFMITSAGCAAAPSADLLIGVRVLQGLSASLVMPQVIALFQIGFPKGQQNRLLGYYGAMISCGMICGQLLGGLLVHLDFTGLGWRMIFVVNLPLCVIAIGYGLAAIPPADRRGSGVRFDPLGVLLLTAAVALLLCPLVFGAEAGWPIWVWPLLAGSLALFIAFGWWESRLPAAGNTALLPMRLFRLPGFANGLPTAVAFYTGNSGLYFVLTLYLQDGIRLAPSSAAFVFMALAVPNGVASLTARSLFDRFGAKAVHAATVVMIVGLVATYLGIVDGGETSRVVALVPGLILSGAGQGVVLPCLLGLVLRRVTAADAGAAAGGMMTAAQVAVALGVAAVGAVFRSALGGHDYAGAFGASVVVLGILAVVSLVLLIRLTARAD